MAQLIPNEIRGLAFPIEGSSEGKHLLSMHQFSEDDIHDYIGDAYAAEEILYEPLSYEQRPFPHTVLKAVMRQPSTRTAGTMTTAMVKLGGFGELISGMSGSSEAKGESLADSWIAFATQTNVLGIRTAEEGGPALAAGVIEQSVQMGKLPKSIPVINLGDGRNEHPTQALGDEFTIHKKFHRFEGLVLAVVGDHERYRAHHSLMIGAAILGMSVIAVESEVSGVPGNIAETLGDKLTITRDLDSAMREADVLYIGRNPDEYKGRNWREWRRSRALSKDYESWRINNNRLQQMKPSSLVLHPRPRRNELHPSVDGDPRMGDVMQMHNMIPMRMAIIARHLGISLLEYVSETRTVPDPLN